MGDGFLRLGRPVPQDDGDEDGQQGEADGDQGQERAVPQHQPQGAHKGDAHLDRVLQHPDVVLLDGVDVVAEGGEIQGAVLAGEGLDALAEEPVKGVCPVLPQGPGAERGQKRPIQCPGDQHQREAHDRHQKERAEADGRVARDQIGDPLEGPGDHQLRRGGEKGRGHGHHEIELVLAKQLLYKGATQGLQFLLSHGGFPPLSVCFPTAR